MTPFAQPCQPSEVHADAWPGRDVSIGATGNGVRQLEARVRMSSAGPTVDRNALINEVLSLGAEYSEPGWDGYSATPISFRTKERAFEFLLAIPSSVPAPEVVPEPSGTIAFEWQISSSKVFSVSVMEGYVLAYAGLFGVGRSYGTEVFLGEFPRAFMDQLRRIYPQAGSA